MGGFALFDKDPQDYPFPASIGDRSAPPPGTPRGSLQVFVQRMPEAMGTTHWTLASATQDLRQGVATAIFAGLPGFREDRVRPVSLNGVRGYQATYWWDLGLNESYVLYRGPYVFQLNVTLANAAQTSNKKALMAALHSFRFTP